MSRKLSSDELFKRLDKLVLYRDDGTGSQTLSSDVAAGDSSLTVSDSTSFGSGTWFRVDGGSDLELLRAQSEDGAGQITLSTEFENDHDSGDAVETQEEVELGEVADGGITRSTDVGRTDINVETQRGTYATLTNDVTQRFEFAIVNHAIENLLTTLGIPEDEIGGSGTGVDDPTFARIVLDKINTLSNASIGFMGVLEDLRNVEVRGWNVDFDANQSLDYTSGDGVEIPMAVEVNTVEYRIYA